ncbi:hypothetical protein II906_13595 [bacterium]|nr:hypothetical protein [bacterium]
MRTSPVGFGKIITVSGSQTKMNVLNSLVESGKGTKKIHTEDITSYYAYAPGDGLMANAARKGDKVYLYATFDDADKVKKRQDNYKDLSDIIADLDKYFDLRKTSFYQAIHGIMNP